MNLKFELKSSIRPIICRLKSLSIILNYRLKGTYIHIGSSINKHTDIGIGTNINGPCFISASKNSKVIIGKWCAIAHGLRIRTSNHSMNYPNLQAKLQIEITNENAHNVLKGDTIIGNNVWIGDNVIILPGIIVGDGAVIGAGSIVTKEIEPFSINVGNPSKRIKYRFNNEIIDKLLEIRWWDWSLENMKLNKDFFSTDLTKLDAEIKYEINR